MSSLRGLGHRGRTFFAHCRELLDLRNGRGKRSVLFLGNSHLSAFKLAYDALPNATIDARFFCARGADLFFTEVSDDKIKPLETAQMNEGELLAFYGPSEVVPDCYVRSAAPMSDVAAQFLATGGSAEIDLSGVAAIFYVVGMSPYDFLRLGRDALCLTQAQRHDLLGRILGESFLMRRQIHAIRDRLPTCRHYLIGRPLACSEIGRDGTLRRDDVVGSREATRAMDRSFLFDDVFMPDPALLSASLLATRQEFCIDGRPESEAFQKSQQTVSDETHMNKLYGDIVFRDFVLPLVDRIGPSSSIRIS